MPKLEPISRHTFIADELMRKFPPKLKHPNKKAIFEVACPQGTKHSGTIDFSRWSAIPLPILAENNGQLVIESREDIFGYEPQPQDSPRVEWYLNFADANLFGFYGGQAFAQDEIQVAEHPALAAMRVALPDLGYNPYTVENDAPTPVLV